MYKPIKYITNSWGRHPAQQTATYERSFEKDMAGLLVGRRIVSAERDGDQEAYLTLDNGTRLRLVGNEGCGGCCNGWYDVKDVNKFDNVITNVELEVDGNEERLKLFVFSGECKMNVAEFEGYDNGFYGTGFEVFVEVEE